MPSSNIEVEMIQEPRKYDILCGKEKVCLSHYGSRHFRAVIEAHRSRYEVATTKHQKMTITKEIVLTLNRTSSRFLKYNTKQQGWEELSLLAARDKVSHALRFANLRGNSNNNNNKSKSKQKITNNNKTKNSIRKKTQNKTIPTPVTTAAAATATTTAAPAVPAAPIVTTTNVTNCASITSSLEQSTTPTKKTTTKKKGHVRMVSDDDNLFSNISSLQLFDNTEQPLLSHNKSHNNNHEEKKMKKKKRGHIRKVSNDDDILGDIASEIIFEPLLELNSIEKDDYIIKNASDDCCCEEETDMIPDLAIATVIDEDEEEETDEEKHHKNIVPSNTCPSQTQDDSSFSDYIEGNDGCTNNDFGAVVIEPEDEDCYNNNSNSFTSSRNHITQHVCDNLVRYETDCNVRRDNSGTDLSWIMNEPIMEWDLATDTTVLYSC